MRPLLPDGPTCLTVVTSRRHLTALRPATRVAMDVFKPEEALDFRTHAAPEVPVGDDPDALARVARRCGHLPLALGLVAAQMRTRPGWTATDHADRLDERHHRRFDSGIELALSLSYQHLTAARLLRLLALHPGHDFDRYAAAALTGTDVETADDDLRQLCVDNLLQQTSTGRYVFHDLVRAYAADRAGDEDRPPERRAALTRLLDRYQHTATTAMDTLDPAGRNRRPRVEVPDTPTPPLADPSAAREWLDTERANLVAATIHATTTHGWPQHAIRLAFILYRYFDSAGHHRDAVVLQNHALLAADHTGDREAQAQALTNLGTVQAR